MPARLILSTIVGSRLHGTADSESDIDLRGVFTVPLIDVVSPFRSPPETRWIEGDTDNTAYELRRFCKLCAHGNPTALETLVGTTHTTTPEGEALRLLLPAFLSRRCIDAFLGYARNQEKKFRENEHGRKWKYAAAAIRVLYQLRILLTSGTLIGSYPDDFAEELRAIRRGTWGDAAVMARLLELEQACHRAAADTRLPAESAIRPIEEFLLQIYVSTENLEWQPFSDLSEFHSERKR